VIDKLKSVFSGKLGGKLPSLPPVLRNNLTPMLVLAIAITGAVMMFSWRDQSSYKPVFGAHEKIAASEMMGVLDSEKIPYRVHPDSGQVMVPSAQLGKVRMLLAAKGVTAKLPAGLELMDKSDPLGVSQFVQDVRFRRGLEGELAQSIMTLDAITAARVHLAIARSTSFVASDGDKSSASVVVAMKPGRTLSNEQIAAIVNLVSGSVAGLTPAHVSLIDQAGHYLSSRVDLTEPFDATNGTDSASKRMHDEVYANVSELLGPVLGANNYKVSVTADIDNDKIEETQEKYGADPKITSEAMREEMDKSRAAMGVPGTLSNTPPTAAAPAKPGEPAKPADDASAKKNATTRQYAYDRSITKIKRAKGRVRKMSVAVVLNNASAVSPKTGWSAAELANIDKVLRSGLGIDAARGDVLTVSGLNFPRDPVAEPWWQERSNIEDMTGWGVYALAALLGYLFLARPLLRAVTQRLAPPAAKSATPLASFAAAQPGTTAAGTLTAAAAPGVGEMPMVPLLENYDMPPAGSAVDVMVDHLKVLAGKEPERVAEVVKQWVQKKS
jgi:flagellar M-ring protein FliF